MNINEINSFLHKCKIAAQSRFDIDYNEKNKRTIIYLGYVDDDVSSEILNLRTEDYFQGPVADRDGYACDYWIFKKIIKDKLIYIKLKMKNYNAEGEKELNVFCKSFHFDEKP